MTPKDIIVNIHIKVGKKYIMYTEYSGDTYQLEELFKKILTLGLPTESTEDAHIDVYGDIQLRCSEVGCTNSHRLFPISDYIKYPISREGKCSGCTVQSMVNAEKIYKYFMTFTKKPDVRKEEVFKNFEKFTARADALKITKLWYTKEHWEDDKNPHIHAYIETTKSLPKSRYQFYEKVGQINKQKAKGNLIQIEDYMSKENPIVKLI